MTRGSDAQYLPTHAAFAHSMPRGFGAEQKLVERLVAIFFTDKCRAHPGPEPPLTWCLRTKQRIAQKDRPQFAHALVVPFQPAFGGVAFAVLLCGTVLWRDEFRHQRQLAVVSRSHLSRRQQRVIVLGFAVGMFAGQTAGAAAHLAAKIFAAIESDQNPHIETLKVFHATVLPHLFKSVVEARVEQFGRRRIEQIANVIALSE